MESPTPTNFDQLDLVFGKVAGETLMRDDRGSGL